MFKSKAGSLEFLRFCTVGLANTAVDVTAFFLLNMLGVPYLLAQILSYSAGIINSFFLNRSWTFRLQGPSNILEMSRFLLVNAVSLIASAGLLYVIYDLGQLSLWVSKVLVTGVSVMINFFGSRIWVFARGTHTGDVV